MQNKGGARPGAPPQHSDATVGYFRVTVSEYGA
jgi:hypothetical protein